MAQGKFARSWELTKQAWGVLREDKRLLLFPVVSGTLVFVLTVCSVGGVIAAVSATNSTFFENDKAMESAKPWYFVGLFLLYLVTHFIVTFFQVGLMSCAITKMEGGQPSVRAGLSMALKRVPQIFAWSLVSATVGMLLQMLAEKVGWLGKLVLGLTSVAWNIATFFVVPVLVIEGVGPIEAIKRSAGVIKKTWGESLITQLGFSAVTTLIGAVIFLMMIGLGVGLSIALDSAWPAAVFVPLGILSLVLLAIVQSAMKTVLIAATYRFAATGEVSSAFSADTLRNVFRHK